VTVPWSELVEDWEKALPARRKKSKRVRIEKDFMGAMCDLRGRILPNHFPEFR
jgi:hypothetical protein